MAQRRVVPQLVAGVIAAVAQSVSAYVENYASVGVSMATSSLSGHSVIFEVSNDAKIDPNTGQWDGTSGTWYSVLAQRTNSTTQEAFTTIAATPVYGWVIPVAGWRFFRVRCSAHTSGSATWIICPDDLPINFIPWVSSLQTGTNLIGDVGGQVRATAGGITTVNRLPSAAAGVNATSVKAAAGRLYRVDGFNAAAAVRYLKIYNKASAPAVGTDTPLVTLALQPAAMFSFSWDIIGLYLATGIAFGLTTGASDADTGALTAADVVGLNLYYA